MINKIAFTGREEMLTKIAKTAEEIATEKAHEYMGAGKVFSKNEIQAAEKAMKESKAADSFQRAADAEKSRVTYTSPFAPTDLVSKTSIYQVKDDRNGFFYNVAHGKPEDIANNSGKGLDVLA